jgi:hypothetical protein
MCKRKQPGLRFRTGTSAATGSAATGTGGVRFAAVPRAHEAKWQRDAYGVCAFAHAATVDNGPFCTAVMNVSFVVPGSVTPPSVG